MDNIVITLVGIGELILLIGTYWRDIPIRIATNKYSYMYYICAMALSQLFILAGIGMERLFGVIYGKYIFMLSIIICIGGLHGLSILNVKISADMILFFQKRKIETKVNTWKYRKSTANKIIGELKYCYIILLLLAIGYIYYEVR